MLQCDLMSTAHHCMNKCFDGENVFRPWTFKKQIQESFLWKLRALKIYCAEWLPVDQQQTSEFKNWIETQPPNPCVLQCHQSAKETLRQVHGILCSEGLGGISTIPSAKCSFTSCCGCLSATLSMIPLSQEFRTDRWKNIIAWQEGRGNNFPTSCLTMMLKRYNCMNSTKRPVQFCCVSNIGFPFIV